MKKEKCRHIFKPIKFAKCDRTPEGKTIYIYQMQCMCCGKKYRFGFFPIYVGFKERQDLYATYEERNFVPANWSNLSDSEQNENISAEKIRLKDLLMLFSKKTWVCIVYKCSSNGAYRVSELLEKDEPILNKYVSNNGIELYYELASCVLAEDSQGRIEFFNYAADREIPYLIIEVQD